MLVQYISKQTGINWYNYILQNSLQQTFIFTGLSSKEIFMKLHIIFSHQTCFKKIHFPFIPFSSNILYANTLI
uniref:Uncharacterized protein n=1 Tax=Octopus bimaculoides TaxID=37653 RepID=A0A0L8IAC1_OCTBM